MFDKSSTFESFQRPRFSAIFGFVFFVALEIAMWTMFFAVYSENIGLMDETYLADLPIMGAIFSAVAPDANASHIVAALLAVFSVGTPWVLWSEIHRQNIFENPREWISHPPNQIIASFAGIILILVIGLEVVNLYTLVAKQAIPSGFVTQAQDEGLMAFLAQNKGMAIGVSAVISIINIVIALFAHRAFQNLKDSQEG